ncbi:PR-1-like protein [Gymnopus androsaceus JB14]|uniref:PR-1-like protein n=1 Tax=Gymnopus androsaceus JB14 TaxID=1447944 RepID=A0A6A4I484_9AGAR|nr:PR-1-like protein [Gymnopus androsaceus JB14]
MGHRAEEFELRFVHWRKLAPELDAQPTSYFDLQQAPNTIWLVVKQIAFRVQLASISFSTTQARRPSRIALATASYLYSQQSFPVARFSTADNSESLSCINSRLTPPLCLRQSSLHSSLPLIANNVAFTNSTNSRRNSHPRFSTRGLSLNMQWTCTTGIVQGLALDRSYGVKTFIQGQRNGQTRVTGAIGKLYSPSWDRGNPEYGENIAARSPNGIDVGEGLAMWMAEASDYNYFDPTFSEDTGHFTQVVWNNTRAVACWISNQCNFLGRGTGYLVCRYDPPGNVEGEFAENVGEAQY